MGQKWSIFSFLNLFRVKLFAKSWDLPVQLQSQRSPSSGQFPDPISPSAMSSAAETSPPSTTAQTQKWITATALRVPAWSASRETLHHYPRPQQHHGLPGLRGYWGHLQLPLIKITQARLPKSQGISKSILVKMKVWSHHKLRKNFWATFDSLATLSRF